MPEHDSSFNPKKIQFFTPASSENGGYSKAIHPEVDHQAVEGYFVEVNNKIKEQFPSSNEGINIDRVNNFFAGLGLRPADAVVLDEDQEAEIYEAVPMLRGGEKEGVYLGELDTAFVFRRTELERINGAEYTESMLVHEQAHGSSRHDTKRVIFDGATLDAMTPRAGHSVQSIGEIPRRGLFIEEGFAEYIRGKYITDVFGMEHGFAEMPSDIVIYNNLMDNFKVPIPSKYYYKTPYGGVTFKPSSYAGAALDFLIDQDPLLLPALLKAREDVDGLREVAARIDAIVPGLYHKLNKDFNDLDQFDDGLRHVVGVLGLDHLNTGGQ